MARKTKTRAEVILLLNPHASASALSRGMVLDVPARGERGTGRSRTGRPRREARRRRSEDAGRASEARNAAVRGRRAVVMEARRDEDATAARERRRRRLADRCTTGVIPLETRSEELRASVRAKMEALGATTTVGELVGKSRERLSAWRRMMMSVVSKGDGAAENAVGR